MLNEAVHQFKEAVPYLRNAVDISVLWILIYKGFSFIKGTYGANILRSIVILAFITFLALELHLESVSWILNKLWTVWVVAILILFQPELRRILTRFGQGRFWEMPIQMGTTLEAISGAVESLTSERIGALICIERRTGLRNFVETGTMLKAEPSRELITSLFMNKSPLHDGAMIIGGGQIIAAGCFLPLSQRQRLPDGLGTRHRAAMGLTEITDAVVVVVSEETGGVSIVVAGQMTRNLKPADARRVLKNLFGEESSDERSALARMLWSGWNPKEESFLRYFFLKNLSVKLATLIFSLLIWLSVSQLRLNFDQSSFGP